jgi:hypothetical protein
LRNFIPLVHHRNTLLSCVFFTLLVSACSDAEEGPLALAVAPETQGAVQFFGELPTLPSLFSRYGLDNEGASQAEAWWASWEMEDEGGTELRSRVRALGASHLLPFMGSSGIRDVVARNGLNIAAVEGVASFLRSPSIDAALRSARGSHSRASWDLQEEEWEGALVCALETADALWQVTPLQVAKDLLQDADAALGRKQSSRTYSQEELIRIRRLMYGASEALDAGDYPRAIRRAYYACQLLGVSPP